MNKVLSLIALVALLLMSACRSSRLMLPSTPIIVNNTDSVRIEYIETVRIDTVTVEVPVPMESAKQVVPDSTSHLETSLAESDAWINPDGTLGHSLTNKPGKFNAEVLVPNISSTNECIKEKEIPVPVPYPVEVEREFTLMEQIKLAAFWYLVGVVIVSIGFVFRKPLFTALRKIIRL